MHDRTAVYSVPKGSETILVAEDNDPLRALLEVALESCGYTVLASASGPEALALAALDGEPIALLISDVAMPGMNGPELARRLAATQPGLKVLLLSGNLPDPSASEAGMAFLQKPFRPSALVARVREILDAGQARNLAARPVSSQQTPAGERQAIDARCRVNALEICGCF